MSAGELTDLHEVPVSETSASRTTSWAHASRRYATNRLVLVAGTLVLLVSNVLFAVQLHGAPAAVLLAGVIGAAGLVAARPRGCADSVLDAAIDARRLGVCALVALALLLLGGEAHVFFANWDWLWRDAVLADLARAPFPPTYLVDGARFVMRAPLGMYMLPAAVAKLGGLNLGHAAMLLQNAAFLTCILYLLALAAGGRALLTVTIFLSFSGLDLLGEILHALLLGTPAAVFIPPMHIEHWTIFQYSSTITQLFWVPNHALPCYWVALMILFCARGVLGLAEVGIALSAALFWSPFAVIGGLPFAAYLFLRASRGTLASSRFWLAGGTALGFLPVAFYMQADAAKVPHGFVEAQVFVAIVLLVSLALKIPHAFVVRATWTEIDPKIKGLVVVALVVLFVLPTMRFGAGNDLVMRASIPALVVLAIAFAQGLEASWPGRRGVCVAALAVVAIGCVTPGMEIVRAIITPSFAVSDCGFISVWKAISPRASVANYLARVEAVPGWVGSSPPLTGEQRTCWPDLTPFQILSPDDKIRAIIAGASATTSRDRGQGPRVR